MIKELFVLASTALCITAAQAQWNDVKTPSAGKEPSRTRFMSFDRRDDAETFDDSQSPFFRPLDGEWDFRLASSPENVDPAFYTASGSGVKMQVPSFWSKGSADELAALKAPMLPADNPVGQYRTTIDIPVSWLDRDIFIRVAGAQSGFTLYVNGRNAGYSEDGSVAAEFNISKYVTDGKNNIGIELYKWTTASWMENNTIEGAGIGGGVYLFSQPRIHIKDFMADASLDSLYKNGIMNLKVVVQNNFNGAEDVAVYFDIADSKGKILKYNYREITVEGMGGLDTVAFRDIIPNIAAWSAVSPVQYQLMMRLRYNGRFTEYIPFRIGFRRLETKNGERYINGQPLTIKAADWKFNGVGADAKTIRAEIAKIKKEGYNTIRIQYAPDKNRLYELCSEAGIYVVDIINLDTSLTGKDLGVGGNIGNAPQWEKSFVYRADNSYGAVRNQTCVIDWTLGESAGIGYNIYKLTNRIKEISEKF